jgi:hypothetical protein
MPASLRVIRRSRFTCRQAAHWISAPATNGTRRWPWWRLPSSLCCIGNCNGLPTSPCSMWMPWSLPAPVVVKGGFTSIASQAIARHLLDTSLGLSFLAFCDAETRRTALALLGTSTDPWNQIMDKPAALQQLLETIQKNGYATMNPDYSELAYKWHRIRGWRAGADRRDRSRQPESDVSAQFDRRGRRDRTFHSAVTGSGRRHCPRADCCARGQRRLIRLRNSVSSRLHASAWQPTVRCRTK